MHDRVIKLTASISGCFAFVCFVTARAADGCQRCAAAALRWPATPLTARWNALRGELPPPHEAAWAVAWSGLVVCSRLVYLGLALIILLGEFSANAVRIPAVLGLPSGGAGDFPALGITTALLLFAIAALFGGLVLEFEEAVPMNIRLFPILRPSTRRVFRLVALASFTLTICMVALLYVAGAALLQGIDLLPALPVLISLLLGILLPVAAIAACWALLLGLLAVLAVVCALLWLLFTGLTYLFLALAGGDPQSRHPLGPPTDAWP